MRLGLTQSVMPDWLCLTLALLIPTFVFFGIALTAAGFSTYVERKVAAAIQRRYGVNQCNPNAFLGVIAREVIARSEAPQAGLLARLLASLAKLALPGIRLLDRIVVRCCPGLMIFMVDGLKLLMKEDLIPTQADRPLFRLAPVLVLMSCLAALACLPFSDAFYIADLNIGIFYIAAITSLEVIGILMAGWASNNKWALLGGMRAAAQIVSYELPAGVAILTVIVMSGTLSMQGITLSQFGESSWQQGWFWQWNVFASPFMLILLPVFFLTGLAESNRTPFDIPEAESELVAGFHVEYSGIRFGFFNMAENIMMCVVAAVTVTLFLGGWSTGLGCVERHYFLIDPAAVSKGFHWWATVIHLGAFMAKTAGLVFVMMWIRWTLPRFRVDQLMDLCWKKLVPIALFCFTGVAFWMALRPWLVSRLAGAGRNEAEAAALLDDLTGVGSLVMALAVLAWLIWFFRKPLDPKDQERWTLIAQSNAV